MVSYINMASWQVPAVLAAAIPGSRVEIEGLGIGSVQPDVAAIRSLARFGASVSVAEEAIVVESDGPPRGCDLDCAAFPRVSELSVHDAKSQASIPK